jgi:hypothetical protein
MAVQGILDLVVQGTRDFPYNQSGRMESNLVLFWLSVLLMLYTSVLQGKLILARIFGSSNPIY